MVTVADLGLLRSATGIVLGSFLVNLVISLAWVRHNLRLASRRGPRTGVPTATLDYQRDWTGRTVNADWSAVQQAAVVVVTQDDHHKHFAAVPEPPGQGRP